MPIHQKIILFFSLLLSLPLAAQGQNVQIGKVEMVKGEAEVIHGGGATERLIKQMPIIVLDAIKTKTKTLVKIKMIDDTFIVIGPNSIFKFKQFEFKSKDNRKSLYNHILGKSQTIFKRKGNPENLKMEAKGVAMGIRGTEVLMNVTEGLTETTTEVVIGKGIVQAKVQKNGSNKTKDIALSAGDYYTTAPDKKESMQVKKLTPKMIHQLRNFEQAGSFGQLIKQNKETAFVKPKKGKSTKLKSQKTNSGHLSPEDLEKLDLEDKMLWDSFTRKSPPYTEIMGEMNWPKNNSKWVDRKPASTGTIRPKCRYQIACIKRKKYRSPGSNKVVSLCEETRTLRVPENCTP